MPHSEIIENCKKIIIEYLFDVIGQPNIVSIILYGSVSRNEESYRNVDGKLYLESDIDVLVVVRNRAIAIKTLLQLKSLCKKISDELRKKWLLSGVNLHITTENKLLNARPNAFHVHLKLNGKVIFGKQLIRLMDGYKYKEIPVRDLCTMIFSHMIDLVRTMAVSGILEENITTDGYNSILKSVRKLTLFLIRAIIMKDGIPLNPYNLTEIKTKRNLYQIKNSLIFNDLLKSYDDIKLSNSIEGCSMSELNRYLLRLITQFNSTIAILTGINYPSESLPIKLILGGLPFLRRLEYSMYILWTNVQSWGTIGLLKFIILRLAGPEKIYLRYYYLLVSGPELIKSMHDKSIQCSHHRKSWLKLYEKSPKPWKYF